MHIRHLFGLRHGLPSVFFTADGGAGGGSPAGAGGAAPATGGSQGAAAPTTPNAGSGEEKYSQSEVDRRVNEAIQKREAAWKKEQEEKGLKETQQYKTLFEKSEAERVALELRDKTRQAFEEKKLGSLAPVFNSDLSTVEGRTKAAEQLNTLIEATVEQRVAERLKTPTPPGKTGSVGAGKLTPEEAGKLSFTDYEKAVKEGRI